MIQRETPATIAKRGKGLSKQIFELALQPFKSEGEKQSVDGFLRLSADIESYLMQHREDLDGLSDLEKNRLRPLAVEIRAYSLRRHLTCCSPHWSVQNTTRPNEFVFFGNTKFEAGVAKLALPLGLSLSDKRAAGTPDHLRWEAIGRSNFAVFDFRHESYLEGRWASISHALGIALSVGTLPVIISDDNTRLPFDVHIDPVYLLPVDNVSQILSDTLAKAAVAQFQLAILDSSILPTINYVLEQAGDLSSDARYMRSHVKELKKTSPPDPVNGRFYLETLISRVCPGEYELLTPVWPASYPNEDTPCCFHILPFSLPEEASSAVEEGCRPSVVYQRGDSTGDVDIIKGIWDGLSQATHVVIDLTPADINGNAADVNPNPNVCLELAMAQVLGRKLLLVRHARANDAPLFPEIAKFQVLPYESAATLTKYVTRFVSQT